MKILKNLFLDIIKKIILIQFYILKLYNLSLAIEKFKIPRSTIFKELVNKSKVLRIFGNNFFLEKDLVNLKIKLKKNYIHSIKVDDLKFKLTFLNYELDNAIIQRIEGQREPSTVSAIRSLVKKGSCVLELGSCYGYFTNIMSQSVGKKGKVVGIEGLPSNFNILAKNIKLNKLENVSIYNKFLSNNSSKTYIQFEKTIKSPYDGINSFLQNKKKNLSKSNYDFVAVERLSTFLKKIRFKPDHIFMDIEGFEVDVIEDLVNNYINRINKPTILFEIHNPFYKRKKNLNYLKHLLSKTYEYIEDSGNLICKPKK
jgi:FkbM family methyltransferase